MRRNVRQCGTRLLGSGADSPGRLLGVVALTGSLLFSACAGTTDNSQTGLVDTTTETTVETTATDSRSREMEPTSVAPTSTGEPSVPESSQDDDDASWFTEADYACMFAIEEYSSWKAEAGTGAAGETLALGAAAAATHAADTIEALPPPTSPEALALQEAVLAFAAAYRDLSVAMDVGTYSEVTAAGDDAMAAADRIRSAAASTAPSCVAMADKV
jgi:hypothetical protein